MRGQRVELYENSLYFLLSLAMNLKLLKKLSIKKKSLKLFQLSKCDVVFHLRYIIAAFTFTAMITIVTTNKMK